MISRMNELMTIDEEVDMTRPNYRETRDEIG